MQLWLLIAAADSTGNLDLIAARQPRPGVCRRAAAEAARRPGWSSSATTVRFRHPLVRSAAYNAAPGRGNGDGPTRALSAAADELGLVELEAWHAAKATLGTDPAVADRLERVADLGRPARRPLVARHRARPGRRR